MAMFEVMAPSSAFSVETYAILSKTERKEWETGAARHADGRNDEPCADETYSGNDLSSDA
jgi:hypothetical protein